MSVLHINNQEAYFLGFQGIGICLTVTDGKLTLASPGADDSAESSLNDFLSNLRRFVKSRRHDMRKSAAIRPLLDLIKDSADTAMPRNFPEDITKALAEADVHCKAVITEAEDLILDVADLMMKFNVTITSASNDNSDQDNNGEDRLKSLLARITGGR